MRSEVITDLQIGSDPLYAFCKKPALPVLPNDVPGGQHRRTLRGPSISMLAPVSFTAKTRVTTGSTILTILRSWLGCGQGQSGLHLVGELC